MIESVQLDEKITFKQFVGASLMGSAALASGSMNREPSREEQPKPVTIKVIHLEKPEKIAPVRIGLVKIIVNKYKVDPFLAGQIVEVAKKHARPTFPKTEDILTIIGIESSFNPLAVSKDKGDLGLMQVRAGVWKLSRSELVKIEDQIKHGAAILAHYYEKLKNEEAAIASFNIGITQYLKNKSNSKGKVYLAKFNRERRLY